MVKRLEQGAPQRTAILLALHKLNGYATTHSLRELTGLGIAETNAALAGLLADEMIECEVKTLKGLGSLWKLKTKR